MNLDLLSVAGGHTTALPAPVGSWAALRGLGDLAVVAPPVGAIEQAEEFLAQIYHARELFILDCTTAVREPDGRAMARAVEESSRAIGLSR